MTKRGDAIIFCGILAPPQCPPHSPDATIFIYLKDREDAPLSFVGFSAPNAPPPLTTPQYLTILMTERGGAIIFCRILAPPNAPPLPRRHNT